MIGFDGLLLSDDLSMKALGGSLGERAEAALAAGCDVALHCNGDMDEMRAVADAARPMNEAALARFARGEAMRGAAADGIADMEPLQERLDTLSTGEALQG
jgi:beta-N-acetylhexosaminidase